jgi:tetratricopeptide (TPR) repeat protein
MTSKRMMGWVGAVFLTGASAAAVGASPLEDCRTLRLADLKLAACESVIAAPSASADDKALAYRYRADARAEAGALTEAIADYSAALALKPDSVAALAGRGRARLARGDYDGAVGDLSEALRRAPRAVSFLLDRGHAHLARGDAQSALADFQDAVKLEPKSAAALNSRGLAWRKLGQLDRAYQDYTAAIMLNPVYALAYANRGYVEEARGRKKEAVSDLQTALLIDSSMAQVKDALVRLGGTGDLTRESERRIALGRKIAEDKCSRCHAVGPEGTSPHAKAPAFRTLNQRHPLQELRQPLTRGIAAPHDEMPRFRASIGEIDAIVAYVNDLNGRK